jgi:glutathione S-transferase
VHLDYVEAELAQRPWFAGNDMTVADVMMSFPLEVAATRADAARGRPHIALWIEKIHSRPAYQAAMKAGGTYAYV